MKRSIKSNQREVTQLHIIVSADGTATTGLDQNQVSVADTGTGVKTVTLSEALQDMVVQVSSATTGVVQEVSITSTTVFVVNGFDTATGAVATDGIAHITVTGSRVTDRY
jgi:hypothetical protein